VALRKPELPILPLEKQPLPADHPQCTADDSCRKPGLFSPTAWGVKNADEIERICRDHLYTAIEKNRGYKR
jgi:hypothetical protein